MVWRLGGDAMAREGIRAEDACSCLLCGSRGALLYPDLEDCIGEAPGTWALMRCARCGLVWLHPRPVPADVAKLYACYYTHSIGRQFKHRWRDAIKRSVLSGRFGYHHLAPTTLHRVVGRLLSILRPVREPAELSVMTLARPASGSLLLDVGCGNGEFLHSMRQLGWQVTGVEPDETAAAVARSHYGVSVYCGTLEAAGLPPGVFDAITMRHVIEHLSSPVETLRECCRILRPGGRVVVLTPNVESLGHRSFGRAWRGLEVPRHLQLFGPRALRAAAELAGLKVVMCRSVARAARWMWAESEQIARCGALHDGLARPHGAWAALRGALHQAAEYALWPCMDAGEELLLVASSGGE